MTAPPSLAPALLVSMPQLVDPNFNRSVVLLCKHSEDGAFGLVVNRPLLTTGRVVVNLEPPVSTERELQVWIGGPVEPHRSWILVKGDPETDEAGMRISPGLYLSTSPDLLRCLLEPDPPPLMRLIVGYASWGAGQLEEELHESAWLLSDVDAGLVFNTPAERMWETSIRRLGAESRGAAYVEGSALVGNGAGGQRTGSLANLSAGNCVEGRDEVALAQGLLQES